MASSCGKRKPFDRPWDRWGMFFVIPGLLYFVGIFVYPTVQTIWISFTDYNLFTPPRWSGLQNYATLFQQGIFQSSVAITAIYVLVIGIMNYVLPFAVALLLYRSRPVLGLSRAIYFLPVILPWVVVSALWKIFYLAPGPIDSLLGLFGIHYSTNILTEPSSALVGVMVTALWKSFGFYVVLFLTGLNSIPDTYYEVADIEGASAYQRFVRITFPLMRSTSLFIATVNFIGAIKEFDPFQVMTDGGPAQSTNVLTLFIYKTAFLYLRMGRAAAASLLMCAAIVAITIAQFRIFREEQS